MKYIDYYRNKCKLNSKIYFYIGWLFAIMSFFYTSILFGALGIIMGIIGKTKSHRGTSLIFFSVFFTLMGQAMYLFFGTFLHTVMGVMSCFY